MPRAVPTLRCSTTWAAAELALNLNIGLRQSSPTTPMPHVLLGVASRGKHSSEGQNMSKTILIMAAGTGGHVMPGLAIAERMQARGWRVHWLGTHQGMENKLVPPRGIPMTLLNFTGMRGKGMWHLLTGMFQLLFSMLRTRRLIRKIQPQVVLGMGGYVTVPGGWAARMAEIPLAVINADAALLMSNRALASAASRVLFGFEAADGIDPAIANKVKVTGNPVRHDIAALMPPEQRYGQRTGPLRLLVLGGSLGASVLNEVLPQALARIPLNQRPLVTHQSGAQHLDTLQAAYRRAGVQANVVGFIDNMAAAYAEADVLVCRAGAITVSEITVAGVASILVPLMVSTTSHQQDNAQWMAAHDAAIHLPQATLSPEGLAETMMSLDRTQLQTMASAARALARPNATQAIVEELEAIALPMVAGRKT